MISYTELDGKWGQVRAIERKIEVLHIRPGKPTENAYVESFHGRLRDECLNTSWFWNLFDARKKIDAWRIAYNSTRSHSALAYTAPDQFAQQWNTASLSARKDRAGEQPQSTFSRKRSRKMYAMISDTELDEIRGQLITLPARVPIVVHQI